MTEPARDGDVLRIDGGTATELQRAGIAVESPWWTTRALLTDKNRTVLSGIHQRFLAGGAQVLTANTFRCNLRSLRALGLDGAGLGWMVHAAVGVAKSARQAAGSDAVIAGSMAPVADCYRPDLVPNDDELRAEHQWLATELMRSGVDIVLIETMNSIREARIALEQVLAAGGVAWVSFVCADGARLLSGEPLADAARAVERDGADGVLVNCAPLETTEACLAELSDSCDVRFGAYPNVEDRLAERAADGDGFPAAVSPADFAATLRRWHGEYGASLLGGCCGSGPDHIAAVGEFGSAPRAVASS
ncbi:homocysteine S-methyltransferase family protein [Haloechinothrix salitolerans]|uniref:Homocysteine S-methyltransferase family protein n=1 Tax=Haloechinothrix salitolerans TaxID=926830 RepID=A0ABW2BW93_9PSEU